MGKLYAIGCLLLVAACLGCDATDLADNKDAQNLHLFLVGSTTGEEVVSIPAEETEKLLREILADNGKVLSPAIGSITLHRMDLTNKLFCSKERHQNLIRLFKKTFGTSVGFLVERIWGEQKNYCRLTYDARLYDQMSNTMARYHLGLLHLFSKSSNLPLDSVYGNDDFEQTIIDEAVSRFVKDELVQTLCKSTESSKEASKESLVQACKILLTKTQLGDFLWMLKILNRPKMNAKHKRLMLGAKLCHSMLHLVEDETVVR